MLDTEALGELEAGDARRAGPVDHEAGLLDAPACEIERVDQGGADDDRGAVLIIVEHRDVHGLAQAFLDDEALRRLDVLEVDAREALAEEAYAIDELIDVVGVDLEVDGVDVGEALEQDRLALHHRLGRQRAEIAEAEDGRAVRHHGHEIAPRGVEIGGVRILGNAQTRHRDTRRIGQ